MGQTVYISSGGKCYHQQGCTSIQSCRSVESRYLSQLKGTKYAPCKVCFGNISNKPFSGIFGPTAQVLPRNNYEKFEPIKKEKLEGSFFMDNTIEEYKVKNNNHSVVCFRFELL